MSEDIQIPGNWKAELIYGEECGQDLMNKTKLFRLTLDESDGDITGESIDTEGTGVVPVSASVSGFIEDGMISFVKLYETCYLINEKGEVKEFPDKDPPEINFSGYYNPDDQSFEGDWHMIAEVKQLTFAFAEKAFSGTWRMVKEN